MADFRQLLADAERWHDNHPWTSHWYGLRHRIREAWSCRRIPRWMWQRARRGYSVHDWWSFDTYIAGVIGRACRDLRENGIGYPGDVTEDEWHDILDRISGPLLAYEKTKFACEGTFEEEMARYEAAREAMHLFAQNLGSMWD